MHPVCDKGSCSNRISENDNLAWMQRGTREEYEGREEVDELSDDSENEWF